MFKKPVLVLVLITVLGAVIYGFTQGFNGGQSGLDSTSLSSRTPTSTPAAITQSTPIQEAVLPMQKVQLFMIALEDNGSNGQAIGCGDSLVPITTEIPETQAVLQTALAKLLAIHQQIYSEGELYNALYNSDLQVDSAQVENGTATINLSGQLLLGGVCDSPRVEGQIRATAEQFQTVERVDIFLNGEPLSDVLSGQGTN